MSDIETGADGVTSRKGQAKQIVGQAGEALKAEAQSFASAAQDRVRAEAQKGTQAATKTLGDFANAVRRAGDELAGADQSPASRLVQKAADGLENFSRSLDGKDPGDLLNDVRDFGRRHPVTFIGGAVLVGLALGRFVRATEGSTALPGLRDQELAFADADAFDDPSDTLVAAPEAPLADDLGGLGGSTLSTAPVVDDITPADDMTSGDDITSGDGEISPTTSPIGGR
jgi:hypothetical protein